MPCADAQHGSNDEPVPDDCGEHRLTDLRHDQDRDRHNYQRAAFLVRRARRRSRCARSGVREKLLQISDYWHMAILGGVSYGDAAGATRLGTTTSPDRDDHQFDIPWKPPPEWP